MVLIAVIRRRGVETVVDRSWFFVFWPWTQCLAGSERGQGGVSILAHLRKTVGIDQRVSKIRCDLRGETGGLQVRVRLSLRLSLFVVGSARRLRLPTSASSSSSPSYQLSSAPCRCACPPSPLPLASQSSILRHSLRALPLDLSLTRISL
jgi:hypothetical protein